MQGHTNYLSTAPCRMLSPFPIPPQNYYLESIVMQILQPTYCCEINLECNKKGCDKTNAKHEDSLSGLIIANRAHGFYLTNWLSLFQRTEFQLHTFSHCVLHFSHRNENGKNAVTNRPTYHCSPENSLSLTDLLRPGIFFISFMRLNNFVNMARSSYLDVC